MAYEKQTWNTGDVITAEKLNHMEEGINRPTGGLFVSKVTSFDGTSITLDHTFEEILAAFEAGMEPVIESSKQRSQNGGNKYTFRLMERTETISPHEITGFSFFCIISKDGESLTFAKISVDITGCYFAHPDDLISSAIF